MRGSAAPTAIVFTMISMVMTVGYLKYAFTASSQERLAFAREKALYLAETGVNKEGVLWLYTIDTKDTTVISKNMKIPFEVNNEIVGYYRDVRAGIGTNQYGENLFMSRATGVVDYETTSGDIIEIKRHSIMKMESGDFSDFMYFSDSEKPGGGPYTDGTVSFGANDSLEGKIFTNDKITMSQFGCPEFLEGSEVKAVHGFLLNDCDFDEDILDPSEEPDSVKFDRDITNTTKQHAKWIFTADDLLYRSGEKDTLIMTEIEFVLGGFKVKQWSYLIPPVTQDGPPPVHYLWDEDTTASGIGFGRAGANDQFNATTGYISSDTLIFSENDMDGDNVTETLDEYSIGDTILVTSADTITKYLGAEIASISTAGSRYIFGFDFWEQSFPTGHGFVQGEEVILSYKAPLDPTLQFNNFAYYHNHPDDDFSQCQPDGFHHFDFPIPPEGPDIMGETMIYSNRGVIYVKSGQVRVKGVIDGNFTIVTDHYTEYRRHDNQNKIDRVFNNIWLIDDVIYEDSNPESGRVMEGSPNRLGLVSGANVIIANTRANGAKDENAGGSDIIINAAILALDESFVAHYWQNSVNQTNLHGPNFALPAASKGDGRGPYRNPNSPTPTTTANDIRGEVKLWGSVSQKKRGYMKRNTPGPYPIFPGIGYGKDYHYDYNFRKYYGPTHFPITQNGDGQRDMHATGYSEISADYWPINATEDNR